jgi:hypothetical protein
MRLTSLRCTPSRHGTRLLLLLLLMLMMMLMMMMMVCHLCGAVASGVVLAYRSSHLGAVHCTMIWDAAAAAVAKAPPKPLHQCHHTTPHLGAVHSTMIWGAAAAG